jgi:hypothetical protein
VRMSLTIVAIVTGFATTTPADAPKPAGDRFIRGETLDYTLTWLGVNGGSARMSIAPVAGLQRFRMTSTMQSNSMFNLIYRVRDEVESVVDRVSFSTLLYHKKLNERGKRKDDLTVVDPVRKVATRKGVQVSVTSPVFDPLSLIYHLRTLDLRPGSTIEFQVVADGRVYLMAASVGQRETISTLAGSFNTVVVEPRLESGGIFRDERNRLLIWYSDDPAHIPVRIRSEFKAGSITASLRRMSPAAAS